MARHGSRGRRGVPARGYRRLLLPPKLHGVGGLLGLRFRYTGGAEREVGYCTVGPRREMQSIDIGDDEVAYLGRYWVARGERRARGDGDEGHDDDESDEGGGNDRGDDEDRNVWGRMRLVVSLHAP